MRLPQDGLIFSFDMASEVIWANGSNWRIQNVQLWRCGCCVLSLSVVLTASWFGSCLVWRRALFSFYMRFYFYFWAISDKMRLLAEWNQWYINTNVPVIVLPQIFLPRARTHCQIKMHVCISKDGSGGSILLNFWLHSDRLITGCNGRLNFSCCLVRSTWYSLNHHHMK